MIKLQNTLGHELFINPDEVVVVTQSYVSGKIEQGVSYIYLSPYDRNLRWSIKGTPEEIVAKINEAKQGIKSIAPYTHTTPIPVTFLNTLEGVKKPFIGLDKEDALTLVHAFKHLMGVCNNIWPKEPEPGLFPTAYRTLNYANDLNEYRKLENVRKTATEFIEKVGVANAANEAKKR